MTTDPRQAIIGSYLKRLKLPAISRNYMTLAREAESTNATYLDYLRALLEQEVTGRDESQIRRRLRQAQLPYDKRLEDFDCSAVPTLQTPRVMELARCTFVGQRENLIMIGPSGLGKTHLLIALGRVACLEGYRVLFRTAATLAGELELAQAEHRLPKLLRHYQKYHLILVDELGYLPFARTIAQLLFQFFSDRYERGSVAITSNLDFAHWTEVFGDERMTAALLDRLTHRSHLLVLEGDSYRFRQSLQRQEKARTD